MPLTLVLAGLTAQRPMAQQAAEPAASVAPDSGSDRFGASAAEHLVDQKLRLLETYLASKGGERLAQSAKPEIERLVAEARDDLASARQAVAAGDFALATALTDRGIRNMAKASASAGRRQTAGVSHERLETQRRQIRGYLATLNDMLQEPSLQAAHGSVLRQVEALLQRSEELAETEAYEDADTLLNKAYPMTLKIVSELHQGRTSVARLEFAGPEDEFNYESKRFESYEMLVAIALNHQGRTDRIVNRAATDRYLNQGRLLRAEAEEDAKQGRHEVAIQTMEQATQQLVDALRASGVEVSYQ